MEEIPTPPKRILKSSQPDQHSQRVGEPTILETVKWIPTTYNT